MRLILHIGTEKTGSTALQRHLDASRAHLVASGFALPTFLPGSNHRALASVFVRDELDDDYLRAHRLQTPQARARHRAQLLRRLREDLEQNASEAHSYVISSEHFHSRLLAMEEVQAFVDSVAPLFSEVQVICYLRRQDRMALSFYSEKLRGGFIPPSILPIANIRRLRPALPPFFDYESLLARWSDALGEQAIVPTIYSRAELQGGDVVVDFYRRIGCAYPEATPRITANEALSAPAQMALLAFNRANGGDLEARTRSRPARERLKEFLQFESGGEGILPAQDEAEEFLAAFRESNRRVARRWFNRDELFPADSAEYPERESEPDWESAAQLLARFVAGEGGQF